jgi:hypothetical protein
MRALLERSGPLGRLPFVAFGTVLFAIKIALDAFVARAFDQPYSVLYYVSPLDAPLLSPGGRMPYWLAMWAVALPFMAVGVWLTLRRLRDAELPLWLVILFFVPFANLLFFLAAAVVPSRVSALPKGPYGDAAARYAPRSVGGAMAMAGSAGAVVALGMVGISVGIVREYGAALFLGAPTISAFTATLLFGRIHGPSAGFSFVTAMIAQAISFVVMLAFAIEGAVCLMMAAPLASMAATVGWGIGLIVIRFAAEAARPAAPTAMAILPVWLVAGVLSPMPPERERVVESTIMIDATPEVVWNRVLAFEELPPPTELLFRAGVAYPTGATIEGSGRGAVRRCRFSTGEFVEPITAWQPGRELAFDVQQQPDPMREMTPWSGPRPPHLDGFFATTRGQFLLEPAPGGRTRLTGRTWYTIDIFPRPYWAAWADSFVHTIHLRVMRQIERLAERDRLAATR